VLGTFAVYATTPGRPAAQQLKLIALATDVAALAISKHRSERALRESEERNRLLIRAAEVGLWDWNLVTNEVYFSPEWKQQLGYADDELPNRFEEWERRLHPEDRPATLDAIRDFRLGRRPAYDIEFRLRHKDGSWRWMFSRADFTRDADGQPVRMMGCHLDITARREAEAARAALETQLFEAHKMQAIGTLAGGIAHDFNNILASILVNVTLAQQDARAGRSVEGSLSLITQSSLRARDLVQQILAFSRREPRTLVNQPVRPLVAEGLDLLRSTLPAGVRLVAELSDEPLYACVAASQLQQALINLCTNAWQALPGPGGRIEVGLGAVNLGFTDAQGLGLPNGGAFVRLWVRDSGQGMDDETRARIFEPFFTTKPRGQGTGLGLSVVHGIMVGHGGAIAVESAPGRGSVFSLYFPAATVPDPVEQAGRFKTVASPPGQGQHVLYVDDDEMVVDVVKRLLLLSGYQATCLASGGHALELLGSDPGAFDLVIADYNMPDLSGLDIAREVARVRADLPVVVSSGYVSEALVAQALNVGVRALLDKQNTFEEMIPLVQRVLAGVAGRPGR
jgi:PAS domain S-box-containing protein